MSEVYAPVARVMVVAALLAAIGTLMLVTVQTARAAGALAIGSCGAYGEAYDFRNADEAGRSRFGPAWGWFCACACVARPNASSAPARVTWIRFMVG